MALTKMYVFVTAYGTVYAGLYDVENETSFKIGEIEVDIPEYDKADIEARFVARKIANAEMELLKAKGELK